MDLRHISMARSSSQSEVAAGGAPRIFSLLLSRENVLARLQHGHTVHGWRAELGHATPCSSAQTEVSI